MLLTFHAQHLALLDPSWGGLLWVIAIGLTVLVLDVFFATEVLSWLALMGISLYVSLLVETSLKWRVLVFLVCWLLTMWAFATVGRRGLRAMARKLGSGGEDVPHSGEEVLETAVGSRAVYRLIDGNPFAEWNGDLWPATTDQSADLEDGQPVRILSLAEGHFHVTALDQLEVNSKELQ